MSIIKNQIYVWGTGDLNKLLNVKNSTRRSFVLVLTVVDILIYECRAIYGRGLHYYDEMLKF